MDELMSFIQGILNLGAPVMLPVVICLLGLFFRLKLGEAIKAGLLVGIGFQGLNLVVGLMMTAIDPVIQYYSKMGSGYTTLDIGFAAVGGASWTVPFALFTIPVIIGINLLFIKLKWTKVMNIDVWNYIHFLIPGAMAYALSGNVLLGFGLTIVLSVTVLFVGQYIAPKWSEYFGLEGTTCTTFNLITLCYPIGVLVNKIIDKIPGLNKINLDIQGIEDKLGFVGDPAFIGVIIGAFLAIITKQDFGTILTVAMGMSAVMILLPRMVSIMMEGLSSIGNAASAYMRRKVGDNSNIYIGMDVALGLGDPCCITVSALAIPITILLAFLIPNMTYFPLGLLTSVCYLAPPIVMASKGNLLRSLLGMITCLAIVMFCANIFAPEATAMMSVTGVHFEGMITDVQFGANPGSILVALVSRLF